MRSTAGRHPVIRMRSCAELHEVLFEEWGFTGNAEDYYAPDNSYLPRVLQTRRGIPVTLSLIYKAVAQQVGLIVRDINTPVHFLAAVEVDRSWMIVDAFDSGQSRPAMKCLSDWIN